MGLVTALGLKYAIFAGVVLGGWAAILDVKTERAIIVAAVGGILSAIGTIVGSVITNRRAVAAAEKNRAHIVTVEAKVDNLRTQATDIANGSKPNE